MSQLTTHILDTSKGRPAEGVRVALFQQQEGNWTNVASGQTNQDGRIPGLLPANVLLEPGTYKLHFETKSYFDQNHIASFYPFVDIVFSISDASHYHVPLLLNPYGYATYRGS